MHELAHLSRIVSIQHIRYMTTVHHSLHCMVNGHQVKVKDGLEQLQVIRHRVNDLHFSRSIFEGTDLS